MFGFHGDSDGIFGLPGHNRDGAMSVRLRGRWLSLQVL